MDTVEITPMPPLSPARGTATRLLLNFLVHHNPFYLLSALCMIAGCYALNSALETRSGELGKLFLLLGTINAYELLLIVLGLYLISRHRLFRDGRTLLLLETVFLVDLTFLNAETAATSFWAGVLVNGILLVLALVKVGVVLREVTGRLPVKSYLYICAHFCTLATLPCVLKWEERHGGLTNGVFYGCWWIAGLLLIFFELQSRLLRADPDPAHPPSRRVAWDIRLVYQVVPYLSLLAHLGMLHWVYKETYYLAYASPVLLGFAVLPAHRTPRFLIGKSDVAVLRFLLPVGAVVFSRYYPNDLATMTRWTGRLALTPLMLTAAVAYLVYIYAYVLHYAVVFISGAVAVALMLMFGPTLDEMANVIEAVWNEMSFMLRRLIPQSAGQWGIVAVGGAFAFLGIGAAISLHKQRPAE